jgi:acyl-CoA hydrolase
MDEMAFLRPVHVGDIVRTFAQVNWAGSSSMEIGVRVEAQPWNDPGTPLHVASAYLVFVAVDEHGHARKIPGLAPRPRKRYAASARPRSAARTGWREAGDPARREPLSRSGAHPTRRGVTGVACDW